MKVYSITFNTNTLKIEADIHEIEYSDLDDQYDQLVKLLNAEGLDVIDYNEEIVMLVDDRGFEKEGVPVFEVKTEDNLTLQLAGKILFVRNVENEESTDFGSIATDDVMHLRNHLNIKLKGILKNPL